MSGLAGRSLVTAAAVECCAQLLEERTSALEDIARETPGVAVNLKWERHQVAVRAAAVLDPDGGPAAVERAAEVLRGILRGEVSAEVELVECRTASCPRRRQGTLTYAGVTCESCGRSLSRVLGDLSAPDCPAWCQRHQAEELSVLVHERVLVDDDVLRVTLEESWYPVEGSTPAVEGPVLAIGGEDGTSYVRATPEALTRLQNSIRAAALSLGDGL